MKRAPLTRARKPAGGVEIDVVYAARRPWVPRRVEFEHWAQAALPAARAVNVVAIRIVGQARSHSLNLRYRGKDKPTNVLSFQGAGAAPDGKRYRGELIICAPVVAQEARSQGKRAVAHWAHMTVHGVLHLCGFDHEVEREALKMESREIQILDRLGFSNPYL